MYGTPTFLHDQPGISPLIKLISSELDISIHVITSQLSDHCDVIGNWLWRHQQNENWASETRGRCVKIVIFISFINSLCHVRNKIMYVLLWQTVSALSPVLFWCLFPSLFRNSGNKHQITLSWVHKQSSMRVHTLFFIYGYIPLAIPTSDWQLSSHIDGLVQDCSNSNALAMELLKSCTEPSILRLCCQKLISRAWISNYIQNYVRCNCFAWSINLLLATKSSYF